MVAYRTVAMILINKTEVIIMEKQNSAFYREICILRILVKMGYIDEKALPHIIDITADDYNSDLVIEQDQICLN